MTAGPRATRSVSVCFPAYNEERTVRAVLEDAHRLLSASDLDYEILVCDDGSTDATGAIIDDVARTLPRMRTLRHATNRGIFATFEHLYAEAAKEFVFLNATDGQWDTKVIFDLLPLTSAADVVIASRRTKHYPPVRKIVSWAFNFLPRLLFRVHTYDAGAVKLVRREIIASCPLVSRSPFSEAERLIRAARRGYRIVEHPVETAPRRAGRPSGANWRLVRQALVDLVRVARALHREQRTPRASSRD